MERKALIAAAVATLAGVALLRLYLYRFELEATGGPRARVLQLVRDVDVGHALERADLGTRELPEAYVESRHVAAHDLDQLVGLALAVPGRAHEALLWTDLASLRPGMARFSGLVPAGMRAITLAQRATDIGALIQPGDRVDVLASQRARSGDAPAATRTVAEGALVLAVGGRFSRNQARDKARGGDLTLAVTPELGRALAEAELGSTLRFSLRGADDAEPVAAARASAEPAPVAHPESP